MENLSFIDEENIPLVNQDHKEYYDERYDTPNTNRIEETSFTDTTEGTSTLRLRQSLKRDKIVSLYRYLGVTGNPGLVELDRLSIYDQEEFKNR